MAATNTLSKRVLLLQAKASIRRLKTRTLNTNSFCAVSSLIFPCSRRLNTSSSFKKEVPLIVDNDHSLNVHVNIIDHDVIIEEWEELKEALADAFHGANRKAIHGAKWRGIHGEKWKDNINPRQPEGMTYLMEWILMQLLPEITTQRNPCLKHVTVTSEEGKITGATVHILAKVRPDVYPAETEAKAMFSSRLYSKEARQKVAALVFKSAFEACIELGFTHYTVFVGADRIVKSLEKFSFEYAPIEKNHSKFILDLRKALEIVKKW